MALGSLRCSLIVLVVLGGAHAAKVDGASRDQFMARFRGTVQWPSWVLALEDFGNQEVHRLRGEGISALWSKPKDKEKDKPHGPSGEKPVKMPADKRQMYFRPVSVTLQCVMALTIGSLLAYTGLSISRNTDELSATFTPSTPTQTLTIASRVASFSPMMCMLFVGCRMYVLATTEGLGEPPQWVKNCMWLSVYGVAIQFLVVIALPIFTKKAAQEEAAYDMTEGKAAEAMAKKAVETPAAEAEEELPAAQHITEATGEQNDVHPDLASVEYTNSHSFMKVPFWILQVVSMLMVYGGVGGVIVGILTFPAQSTKISAAVLCTVCMSILYFFVCFLLWTSRVVDQEAFKNASLAMSSAVRKAPMFAVLFLASRMRALQLDPPYGMPPFWMQCCFYGITGLIYLETIVAAVIGGIGKMHKAYYGTYLFKTDVGALHVLQYLCALISYGMLFPVVYGVYNMKFADDPSKPAPLSTTLKCVIWFQGMYFGVMLVQTLVLFAEQMNRPYVTEEELANMTQNERVQKELEISKAEMPILRDASMAAGISLTLAPLLSILFVATRMRALQITNQLGAPPGWAQDCMFIAVFATGVQSLCCLVMPIFVGSACKVDDDGNPDYDLEPMIGAYAVAVVKYVALMALHGSTVGVCIAVYAMTPETAHSGGRFITSTKALFEGLAIAMVVFMIALLFSSAKVIGMGIKMAIEAADRELLGVDITIKKCALNLFKGFVQISRLKVHQPDEEIIYTRDENGKLKGTPQMTKDEKGNDVPVKLEWKYDYIAKVDLVLLKINLCRLITTLGKEFELQNLSIKGIHINVEKPDADIHKHNSNVEYIIQFLDALGLIPPPEEPAKEEPKKEEPKKEEPKKEEAKKEEPKKEEPAPAPDIPKVILRKIVLGDIGAGVCIRGIKFVKELEFHPTIGLIEFDDIQRDIFGNREDLTPSQTAACIIKAIAQKIFKTVVKEIPAQVGHAMKAAAGAAVSGVKTQIKRTLTRGLSRLTGGDSTPSSPAPGETTPGTPGSPHAGTSSPKASGAATPIAKTATA